MAAAAQILLQAEPRPGRDRTGLPAHLRDRLRPGRVRRSRCPSGRWSASWATRSSRAPGDYYKAPPRSTGKRVAVIGSGPAGLSAAHYLRSAGHEVDRLREDAGGRRPAQLRHPALPSAPRRPAQADRRHRRRGRASSPWAPRSTRPSSPNCRRTSTPSSSAPAPGRRPGAGIQGEECLHLRHRVPAQPEPRPRADGRQERGDHRRRQHRHRRGPLAAAPGRQADHHVPPHPGRDARHRGRGRRRPRRKASRSSSSPRRWRPRKRAARWSSPVAAWSWATSTRAAGPARSRWRARSSPCSATRS